MTLPFEGATPPLGLEATPHRTPSGTGGTPLWWGCFQSLPEQIPQAQKSQLTVLPLGPFLCDHNPQTTFHQPRLEMVQQSGPTEGAQT